MKESRTPYFLEFTRILPRFFTWLFAFSLIFSLYDELNWEILVTRVIVAYVFLTLEKISRSLKDPFENNISDTPMTAICRTIEIDLREMLEEQEVPPPLEPGERNSLLSY